MPRVWVIQRPPLCDRCLCFRYIYIYIYIYIIYIYIYQALLRDRHQCVSMCASGAACVYVRARIYIVHTYTHRTYTCVRTCTYTCVHEGGHACACTHVCARVRMYMCVCVHMCVCDATERQCVWGCAREGGHVCMFGRCVCAREPYICVCATRPSGSVLVWVCGRGGACVYVGYVGVCKRAVHMCMCDATERQVLVWVCERGGHVCMCGRCLCVSLSGVCVQESRSMCVCAWGSLMNHEKSPVLYNPERRLRGVCV